MKLRALTLPMGGMLAWNDPAWLQYILPRDSWKKRFFRVIARLPLFWLVSRQFDGQLVLDGQKFGLEGVLALVSDVLPAVTVWAIFVNSQRNPPRIYLWVGSKNQQYFLKIGLESDHSAFKNEFETAAGTDMPRRVETMRPLALRHQDGLVLLLSEGLDLEAQRMKKKLSPENVISLLIVDGIKKEGFFGGLVHADLASNNVFLINKQLLVVDWEFAVCSGPNYCDLIGLGAACVVANARIENTMEEVGNILSQKTGFRPSHTDISNALSFLASRGNKNALHVLRSQQTTKKATL